MKVWLSLLMTGSLFIAAVALVAIAPTRAVAASGATASPNAWKPISALCGIRDAQAKEPYSVQQFVLREKPSLVGSHADGMALSYSHADFPFQDYRVMGSPAATYRIVVEASEEALFPKQYGVRLALYEDKDGVLTRRSSLNMMLDGLQGQLRLAHQPKDGRYSIACYVSHARESNVRKPAQSVARNSPKSKSSQKSR